MARPRNHAARLNSDGSLDTTFDPNNILSGPVYSMSLDSPTFFNLTRFDGGGTNEDDQAINLGNFTAGTLTVDYNFLAMTNDLRVFYGDTNVTAGTGVLIYDTGNRTNGPVTFMLPFGPIGGLTTNLLTIVMNQGNSTNGATAWMYTASVSAPRFLVVGG